MEMSQVHNIWERTHTFRIMVTNEEMAEVGYYKLGKKPTPLQVLIMLKRIAEKKREEERA